MSPVPTITDDSSGARPKAPLELDAGAEVARIAEVLRTQVGVTLRRRGLVVGMSGGVDSSVCAALAVRALGASRVFGLFMPERDSDPASLTLARHWADALGIAHATEDVTATLEACGCYARRDEAIRRVVPEYADGWRCKLVLPGDRLASDRLNVSHLVAESPSGERREVRMPAEEYRQIVAATNFKQRVRAMMQYYHADRLHYAVVGTPNRLEYDQGFFVKGGDGLADVKPIAHLYKTQVYSLAAYLGVPAAITSRPPTTDTFSLPQSQEEFYFTLPAKTLDHVLAARVAGRAAEAAAADVGLPREQVERAYREIERKRGVARYLHAPPLLADPNPEPPARDSAGAP